MSNSQTYFMALRGLAQVLVLL